MPPAVLRAAAGLAALSLAAAAPANQRTTPAAAARPAPRIEGVVKDGAGKPIEKALVMARPSAAVAGARTLETRSDANGRFTLAVPRAGRYALRVEAAGLAPHAMDRLEVPSAALTITLRKGASLTGVVRDARGRPVAGARVDAIEGGWKPFEAPPLEPEAGRVRATTDARGAFRLEGLRMAAHRVVAGARGLGGARRDGVVPGMRLEMFLTPGAALRGIVRGPDRQPLAGATLSVAGALAGSRRFLERTDGSGSFQFLGVPAGVWRMVAFHPGAAPALAEVVLEKNAEKVFELSLGPPARLRGRLVDPEQRPVPDGRVSLMEIGGTPVADTLGELLGAATDREGRFVLEGLARAPLALAVRARGFVPLRVEAAPDGPALDLGDVVVERGLTIPGRVRDEAGGGIAGADVKAMAMGQRFRRVVLEATSGADGGFVIGGAEQGLYGVVASASGYAERIARVSAGAEPVEIVLPRGGTLTGTVVDEKGAYVPAFDVLATPAEQGDSWEPVFADGSEGRFQLEGLSPGEWTLEVTAAERAGARLTGVRVRAGAVMDAGRIRLSRGASVKGRVTDQAGGPVAGAQVRAQASRPSAFTMSRGFAGAVTDASGAFELTGVEPGRVDVVADHPEYASGRASNVEVDAARGATDVRITLTAGARVEGVVRRRDGRPLERMRLQAMRLGAAGYSAFAEVASGDGTFRFEHLPAGTFRLMLMSAADDSMSTGVQQRQVDVAEGETASVEFVVRDILVGGTVTRRGEPSPGVRVTLRGPSSGILYGGPPNQIPSPAVGPQRGWAVTRQDGSYELIVGEPGPYTALVTSGDGRLNYPSRQVQVPDADAYALDLAVGGVAVPGQTVDAETGGPVQAFVGALPMGAVVPGAQTMAGADGRFQLELEPGEYTLLARAPGFAPEQITVKVEEDRVPDVRLALGRGGSISGRVVDASGRPAGALSVVALAEEQGTLPAPPRQITRSEPDGTFIIKGLGRGSHTLTAGDEAAGFGVLPGVASGTTDAVLRLAPGGRVRVMVLALDGTPVAGFFVGATRVDGRPFMGTGSSTDSSGVAEFAVPAGRIEVMAADRTQRGSATTTVTVGETASVEIRLRPREGDPGIR